MQTPADLRKDHQICERLKARRATRTLINRFQMTGEMGQIEQDENLTDSLFLGPGNQLLTGRMGDGKECRGYGLIAAYIKDHSGVTLKQCML